MKKAKLVLSAVAVFAVIGGAFAFKASRAPHQFYKTNAAGNCVSTVQVRYTTDENLAIDPNLPIVQNTYYTTTRAGVCPTTTIFSAQ